MLSEQIRPLDTLGSEGEVLQGASSAALRPVPFLSLPRLIGILRIWQMALAYAEAVRKQAKENSFCRQFHFSLLV